MEGFKFSLRDIPKREFLKENSQKFKEINIEAVECILHVLRTASDISSILDKHFTEHNISEGKFAILMLLYRQSNHKLTPVILSKKAEVTKGTMTGLIAGLEKQGFIEKIANECDQRGYLVHLTKSGLSKIEKILPEHYNLISAIMNVLNDRHLKELTSSLHILNDNLLTFKGRDN